MINFQPNEDQMFTLRSISYGASVHLEGSLFNPEVSMKINDGRLKELANKIKESIEEVIEKQEKREKK